jgi:hypothetical protein
MDVSADCYRRVDDLDIGLFDKEFARFIAELTDSGLWNWLAGTEELNVTSNRDASVGLGMEGWVSYRSRSLMTMPRRK